MDPLLHLSLLVPVMVGLSAILILPMQESPPRAFGEARASRFAWPTLAVLAIVMFGVGADLVEGASRVWATIYLRDSFDVSKLTESMALPALILTMAIGRLFADRWIDRFGPAVCARYSLAIAIVGVTILTSASNAWLAILGFAIAGLGTAVVYPLMISSAARIGDRDAADNVAATTLMFQLLMLVSPMLVGGIAEWLSVRMAFASILPLLLLGWLMAGRLR